jgi:hypothetical protein
MREPCADNLTETLSPYGALALEQRNPGKRVGTAPDRLKAVS